MNNLFESILRQLPAAIYTTDAIGQLEYYNEATVELWGLKPDRGSADFFASWKLYRPDGTSLPYNECPMAIALREQKLVKGQETVAERPDGTRISFSAHSIPMLDQDGRLTGAVNMLVDISDHKTAEAAGQRLAAIVESSDDAILSKDINGIITSWNRGAERLFGYHESEAVGRPVTILIPQDRQDEEPEILARIRRGERIDHYETIRQRKDGSLLDISLSVSPIVDSSGRVVGASKIARDISDRRRAEQQRELLLGEMDHRIKNLFSLATGLVNLSAHGATSVSDLVTDLQGKFQALGRAHSLTLSATASSVTQIATFHALIDAVTAPYDESRASERRILVEGPDVPLGRKSATNVALLLHEFATNAVKYGALANPNGRVLVECSQNDAEFEIVWKEPNVHPGIGGPVHEGFGSRLAQATARALDGRFSRDFTASGLEIRLALSRLKLNE